MTGERSLLKMMPAMFGCIALASLLAASPVAFAQSVPDGWSVRGEDKGVAFAPEQMGQGELLQVWVAPPQRLQPGVSLQGQLPQVRQQVGATLGDNCQPVTMMPSGAASQICERKSVAIQYVLLPPPKGDNTAQLVRIVIGGNNVLSRYQEGIKQAMDIAMRGDATRVLRRDGKSEQQIERERIEKAIRTAPGKGVSDREIGDFFVAWEDRQVTGSMTMREVVHTAYLIFRDGTAYEDLDFPPDEFNAAVSRQLQPERWVQWRRNGSGYDIREKDGDWKELRGWQALPARADERLDGSYSRTTGSGDLYSGVSVHSSSWTFFPDGRFKTSSYGTMGTGSMQAMNGFSSSSSTLSNSEGTSTTTGVSATGSSDPSAGTVAAGGVTRQTNDGSAHTGRYRLNGWVLEVLRDNGQYERLLVSFQNAAKKTIDINGQPYGKR